MAFALLVLLSTSAASQTKILIAWHTETNRTSALAEIIRAAAAAEDETTVRAKPVSDVSCDDMRWFDGIALGSPVYWGMYSGAMKTFLDNVQQRCFGWPVTELRWKVGAGFATGAHLSSGKEASLEKLRVVLPLIGDRQDQGEEFVESGTGRHSSDE